VHRLLFIDEELFGIYKKQTSQVQPLNTDNDTYQEKIKEVEKNVKEVLVAQKAPDK